MPKLPVISGKDFIKLLNSFGFEVVRIRGLHYRLKHPDGRVTTIPVHNNQELPKGLLRKIIRDDLELDLEKFNELFKSFNS